MGGTDDAQTTGFERDFERLSPQKQALLTMALSRRRAADRIPVLPRDGTPIRASFAQERLWFLDQVEPGSAAYVMPVAVRLRGALDVALLGRCLDTIVRRHEVLRTTLVARDGVPYQEILAPQAVPLPVVDARGDPDGPAQVIDRHWRELATRAFELSTDLAVRAELVRLADDEHVLFLAMHHVASDGWSMGVFVRELAALYGGVGPVGELPVQYADYAAWQRGQLTTVLGTHLDHWRARLRDAPVLELLTDRPRPATRTSAGASVPIRIAAPVIRRVEELAAEEDASTFMLLQAVFATLLHRWSGQSDLVIGFPVANRERPELEDLIGFFVNTLPLRLDLGADLTFRELLRQTRAECLAAYEHQAVPFEKLVQELQVARTSGPVPLIQVMLALRNVPMPDTALADLELQVLPLRSWSTKFDLCLDLVPEPDGGVGGRAEYSTELFDAGTVERMVTAYQLLLEDLVADPDAPVSRARMVPEEESRRLVETFSGGGSAAAAATAGTLHGLFEQQADRSPDAVAVSCGRVRLSYDELERRANRLAWHLREQGLGPEDVVGVCLHRSEEMVVALLGILKAGAAYVPLDPNYPPTRVRLMAQDADVKLIVTTSAAVASGVLDPAAGDDTTAVAVVRLDADRDRIAARPDERPPHNVTEDNLSYVIYTSGSTGLPKGSVNQHGGVANSIVGMNSVYRLGPADRMLAISSLNYDMSVYEIFGTLAAGARVVVPSDIETTDPIQLRAMIREQGVTAWSSAPALLDMLVNYAYEHGGLDGVRLRIVGVGGDRMPPALPARLRHLLPQVELFNLAGMTEVSYCSTYYRLPSADAVRTRVPWGRPLPNHRVYVLDRWGRPTPVGAPGELFIGGAGPGRGYWRRPALTARTFVPDPYSPEPGGRMYGTGDSARFLADGNLDFLGRLDRQLKVRGFRIEAGEVEGALSAHPAVIEPVVTTHEEPSGERRLVAYLTVRGAEPSTTELRTFLADRLPDHMVPSIFVVLDELPKLPSGKLNRAALPAPSGQRPTLAEDYQPPSGALETVLADVLADVLAIERVGANDDFFELGGHSLLATQAVSRIRELFDVELPISAFLSTATVRDMARRFREFGAAAGADVDETAELVLELGDMSQEEVSRRLAES